MFEAQSQTISDAYKSQQVPVKRWKFQLENGNMNSMTISDPLLESETLASERAKSEFLKNGHKLSEISFNTYRTDLTKNMIIMVRGLKYLIKGISTSQTDRSILTTIRGVRYE